MQQPRASLVIYLTANLIGLFLFAASVLEIASTIRQEGRDYYDFGDSLNFITTGIPTFLVCLLFNFAWSIKALLDVVRRRTYRSATAGAVVLVIWVISILILRRLS